MSSGGRPRLFIRSLPEWSRQVMRKLSWKPRAMWWTWWSCDDERKVVSFGGMRVLENNQHIEATDCVGCNEHLTPRRTLDEVASSLAERECCVAHNRHSFLVREPRALMFTTNYLKIQKTSQEVLKDM